MRQLFILLLAFVLFSCSHNYSPSMSDGQKAHVYDSAAVTLSDFSMKIMGYLNFSVPKDFTAKQFFGILAKVYPDKSRVKYIQDNYQVFVRNLNSENFSVMLCDPKTGQKILEDLSCHLDRVEIQSWKETTSQCAFTNDWKSHCE